MAVNPQLCPLDVERDGGRTMTLTTTTPLRHAKRYGTAESARNSKAGLRPGTEVAECKPCQGWHVQAAPKPPRARDAGMKVRAERTQGKSAPTRNSGPTPKVRALVLARDGHACVCCGLSIIGQRYSLGHRLRASQGGKAVPSNLLTFLGGGGELCHGRIDNRDNPEDEAKGYTVRSGFDPASIPVMFFSPHGPGFSAWLDDEGNLLFDDPATAGAA